MPEVSHVTWIPVMTVYLLCREDDLMREVSMIPVMTVYLLCREEGFTREVSHMRKSNSRTQGHARINAPLFIYLINIFKQGRRYRQNHCFTMLP